MDLVAKQREERRRRILDVARQLIATQGYEGLTMRDLAEKSLVSVPTLYNLFRGKNELLLEAVESYFVDLMRHAEQAQAQEGLSKIISVVETLGRETPRHAAYARSLMAFFGSVWDAGGLHQIATRRLTEELVGALEQMQRKRQLATWADPRALGARLASQLSITTFEWARDQLNDAGLRGTMLYGTGVTLLGLARGKAAARLERLAREHQASAAGVSRPHSHQTTADET
jgi:AcrR family transcriptional regulator